MYYKILLTGYETNNLASSESSVNGNKLIVSDWYLHAFILMIIAFFVLHTFKINNS